MHDLKWMSRSKRWIVHLTWNHMEMNQPLIKEKAEVGWIGWMWPALLSDLTWQGIFCTYMTYLDKEKYLSSQFKNPHLQLKNWYPTRTFEHYTNFLGVCFFSASASSQDTKPRTLQDARDDMESHLVSSLLPEDSTKQRKTGFNQENRKRFEDHLTWEVIIEIKKH